MKKLGYHEGEVAMQTRAGTHQSAQRMSKGIQPTLPRGMGAYLRSQCLAVVASVAARGRIWASALLGQPGFLDAPDERTVEINAVHAPGDPLGESLRSGAPVGLLVIDLAARRRLRVNGRARVRPAGGILVEVEVVFGNCPKYIQARALESDAKLGLAAAGEWGAPRASQFLNNAQREWIAAADTFFIASAHPEAGADASHRGGLPGFVRVVNPSNLLWPDYPGNGMFQTLGNLLANPRAGLLFVDFEVGRTLQLTGTAHVEDDAALRGQFAGAERVVEFAIEHVIENSGTQPHRWRFLEYSPYNPA